MASTRRLWRVGTLLCLLGAAPAAAACVGDCNDNGSVTIAEVIVGINVALGLQPVADCSSFANTQGLVDVVQIVRGVHAALDGCPLPTAPSLTATHTPVPTIGPPTATPDLRRVCALRTGVCAGGARDGHDCSRSGECPGGVCDTASAVSKIRLHTAGIPVPLEFPLSGVIELDAGPVNTDGQMPVTCRARTFGPAFMPDLGFTCLNPSPSVCTRNLIDCDGDTSLSIDVLSDADIGPCAGNAACADSCQQYCDVGGRTRQSSGCVGYCAGGLGGLCSDDVDCLPDAGGCHGHAAAARHGGRCQCECLGATDSGPTRAGDLSCGLGLSLVVESAPPCDGIDVVIALGDFCIPLTTATASTTIRNANFNPLACPGGGPPCMVPAGGPTASTGSPLSCDAYRNGGPFTGLSMVGAMNVFGSALGDVAEQVFIICR